MSVQTVTTTGIVDLPPDVDVVNDWDVIATAIRGMILEARDLGGHHQEIVSVEIARLSDDFQFQDGSLPLRRAEITAVTRLT